MAYTKREIERFFSDNPDDQARIYFLSQEAWFPMVVLENENIADESRITQSEYGRLIARNKEMAKERQP